jgi:hypothetical protein
MMMMMMMMMMTALVSLCFLSLRTETLMTLFDITSAQGLIAGTTNAASRWTANNGFSVVSCILF